MAQDCVTVRHNREAGCWELTIRDGDRRVTLTLYEFFGPLSVTHNFPAFLTGALVSGHASWTEEGMTPKELHLEIAAGLVEFKVFAGGGLIHQIIEIEDFVRIISALPKPLQVKIKI